MAKSRSPASGKGPVLGNKYYKPSGSTEFVEFLDRLCDYNCSVELVYTNEGKRW
jgi:hypothetical protein